MRSTIRARAGRVLAIVGLIAAALAPGTTSVHAADGPLILKVGTDQEFSGLNPWQSVYVLDYEVFTLNYDLLVGYDKNLQYAGLRRVVDDVGGRQDDDLQDPGRDEVVRR